MACLLAGLHSCASTAAQPDQREVWVPANKLKEILAKHPNAVVLSREQYEALVRDAAMEKKKVRLTTFGRHYWRLAKHNQLQP